MPVHDRCDGYPRWNVIVQDCAADTAGPRRRPIVGVIGSGRTEHEPRASEVGRLLARMNVHLLTGGGQGVMAAVSRAFHSVPGRKGLSIGILPSAEHECRPRPGYPNEWIEIAIPTHLPLSGERGTEPLSRNHIIVLASNALVMLPGEQGTLSEAQLATRYGKPLIAWIPDSLELPAPLRHIPRARGVDDVERFLREHLPELERL